MSKTFGGGLDVRRRAWEFGTATTLYYFTLILYYPILYKVMLYHIISCHIVISFALLKVSKGLEVRFEQAYHGAEQDT